MMEGTLILLSEYCELCEIEPVFVHALEEEGLIRLTVKADEHYIDHEQFSALEQFRRWHYDLDVNVEGIEVMRHLLDKINHMQREIETLKSRLKLYE